MLHILILYQPLSLELYCHFVCMRVQLCCIPYQLVSVLIAACLCICMLKPLLYYRVSACVVFCELRILLRPAGTLIFHHAVCYSTIYGLKCTCTPSSAPSSPFLFIRPITLLPYHNHHPPLTTHAPNQSKELSRLALEKTP